MQGRELDGQISRSRAEPWRLSLQLRCRARCLSLCRLAPLRSRPAGLDAGPWLPLAHAAAGYGPAYPDQGRPATSRQSRRTKGARFDRRDLDPGDAAKDFFVKMRGNVSLVGSRSERDARARRGSGAAQVLAGRRPSRRGRDRGQHLGLFAAAGRQPARGQRAGEMVGSVSGGCIEGAVVNEALEVMAGAPPKLLDYGVSQRAGLGSRPRLRRQARGLHRGGGLSSRASAQALKRPARSRSPAGNPHGISLCLRRATRAGLERSVLGHEERSRERRIGPGSPNAETHRRREQQRRGVPRADRRAGAIPPARRRGGASRCAWTSSSSSSRWRGAGRSSTPRCGCWRWRRTGWRWPARRTPGSRASRTPTPTGSPTRPLMDLRAWSSAARRTTGPPWPRGPPTSRSRRTAPEAAVGGRSAHHAGPRPPRRDRPHPAPAVQRPEGRRPGLSDDGRAQVRGTADWLGWAHPAGAGRGELAPAAGQGERRHRLRAARRTVLRGRGAHRGAASARGRADLRGGSRERPRRVHDLVR